MSSSLSQRVRQLHREDHPLWPGELVVTLETKEKGLAMEWCVHSLLIFASNSNRPIADKQLCDRVCQTVSNMDVDPAKAKEFFDECIAVWYLKRDAFHKCLSHLLSARGYWAMGDARYRTYLVFAISALTHDPEFTEDYLDRLLALHAESLAM
jgi:hypothetical protein